MKTGHNLLFRCLYCVIAISLFTHHLLAGDLSKASFATSIDALVERDFEPFVATPESDGPLLRRLSLDLRLLVPSQAELDEFLADTAPDRWQRWVKRFLDDPLHRERMVDWLDKTLLQRRPFQHVDRAKWLTYLRAVVDARKPLDEIVKESVGGVWWNQSERAQQRFFLERSGDPHAIARDLGRVFFGRDMQCAQCHDHPQIDDYLQIDYHGLLAFVSPSILVETKFKDEKGIEQKLQVYAERAARDSPFESVFDKGILFRTGMRAPGDCEFFDPYEAPDERYRAAPMPDSLEGAPNPPTFSRRTKLVSQLAGSNRAFAENWSNRLWALMMGRGLVHPLDMHHPDNPPTNPKLLNALTDALIESGFDMRSLIEQIALSNAYQIGSHLPIESSLRLGAIIEMPIELQNLFASDLASRTQSIKATVIALASKADEAKKSYADAESAWRIAQKERVDVWAELDKSEAAFREVMKKVETATTAFEKAKKLFTEASSRQKLLEEASEKLEQAKSLGLADDAELQQAIVATKSKAEGTKSTLPALEKALADAVIARDSNKPALEAERSRVSEQASKLTPIEERLHAADVNFVAARSHWQKAQAKHVVAVNQISILSRIQKWLETSQSIRSLEQARALAVQSIDQLKSGLSIISNDMASIKKQLTMVSFAKNAIESKYDLAQIERKDIQSQLELLRTTHDSLDKSLALVKSPESLVAAKQAIQVAIDSTQAAFTNSDVLLSSIIAELAIQTKLAESQSSQLVSAEQRSLEQLQLIGQAERLVEIQSGMVQQTIDACKNAMQNVLEERQKSVYMAQTRPLSPEQLCLSILQTTDVLKNHVAAESAELEKQSPLAADATNEQRFARSLQATRQAIDKLRPHMDVFANLYSSGVGQTSDEFFASPDQALYMANGGSVFQWSAPSNSNVTEKLVQQSDSKIASTFLFRSLLARVPTSEEQHWIGDLLSNAGDKKPAVAQELVWSLLTSSEFRIYP